jgi:hypothetical protein
MAARSGSGNSIPNPPSVVFVRCAIGCFFSVKDKAGNVNAPQKKQPLKSGCFN